MAGLDRRVAWDQRSDPRNTTLDAVVGPRGSVMRLSSFSPVALLRTAREPRFDFGSLKFRNVGLKIISQVGMEILVTQPLAVAPTLYVAPREFFGTTGRSCFFSVVLRNLARGVFRPEPGCKSKQGGPWPVRPARKLRVRDYLSFTSRPSKACCNATRSSPGFKESRIFCSSLICSSV